MFFFVLLYRRTPDSTRTDTLGPDPTRVRSLNVLAYAARALRRVLRGGDLLTLAAALVLAVAVMTAVGTLVNRVTAAVSANAAQIIGGDFGFASRQPIDPAIAAAARAQGLAVTRMITFPSVVFHGDASQRSEGHTSELQSLMRIQ